MVRIAVDMDEVIADFMSKEIRLFNESNGTAYTKEGIAGKKLRELHPEETENIRKRVSDPTYFSDLPLIDGAKEALEKLAEKHEIFITTAAMEFPTSFNAKYAWLKEHFAFIPESHYVFCGDKSIISADYLIDDHLRHLETFRGQGILFAAPHNAHETYELKLNGWDEVYRYFDEKY
ncbi:MULTISPECIES: 5' nucleotidase, NT5C type [Enterococcus]|uniref:Uncharacterized protein n=1 Tax=Enterococcus malodoratus ATCC 43197 TaxID=1158601 RepID=R2NXT5_9ENTE|nr:MULTISPECIES: hypothetical protein [Enterococcus]EOH75848.1 hypothetical protein UAI_02858 [Enterococcus malodoratus ATCC 43197]EOT66517.1 hypothetical protein I585_02038 [Enterococcus malodoratus ATCC 43197]SET59331.1 5'(3')-deoxyribonucleotidase [Enterococcus malodoratus]SPW90539.1 Putative 5'(3')-deoxyribonucleotidase [Enterococcus malodoratus]STD69073.1 Putative 5'(3')-deoxyribonucleotidase [Enterococcus malodoratus]